MKNQFGKHPQDPELGWAGPVKGVGPVVRAVEMLGSPKTMKAGRKARVWRILIFPLKSSVHGQLSVLVPEYSQKKQPV